MPKALKGPGQGSRTPVGGNETNRLAAFKVQGLGACYLMINSLGSKQITPGDHRECLEHEGRDFPSGAVRSVPTALFAFSAVGKGRGRVTVELGYAGREKHE